MPTRRQNAETREFRQGAFASSTEHDRGILGNLVAARCRKLSRSTDAEEISVLWWLQQVSWREGGLEEFARALVERCFPSKLRMEIDPGDGDVWRIAGDQSLAEDLKRALVDPASESLKAGARWFPDLWPALLAMRESECAAAGSSTVSTAVTRQVGEELDFAFETRSFVLIEGREGIGKSEAARLWCDRHPGRALYVRLESGSDETSMFRAIARRVGTACALTRNAVDMRVRLQDALQAGYVMLVLDEAHFLWPQSQRCQGSVPKRVDWVRTALVDYGVPVALVSTPQYFATQCERYRKIGWNANQVQRRLTRTVMLPEALEMQDVLAVCRAYFPTVGKRVALRAAMASGNHVARLTMFSHLRKRVDFMAARQSGRSEDELLNAALAEFGAPELPDGNRAARPLQGRSNAPADNFPSRESGPVNRLIAAQPRLEIPA